MESILLRWGLRLGKDKRFIQRSRQRQPNQTQSNHDVEEAVGDGADRHTRWRVCSPKP
jgi:hypothetical protein